MIQSGDRPEGTLTTKPPRYYAEGYPRGCARVQNSDWSPPCRLEAMVRPMETAPHQGPVRLVLTSGERVLAWWWSPEMSALFYGPGDYRAGWFACADSSVEIEDPVGWEPM